MSISIITRKLSKALDAYPSSLSIGDVRKQMAQDLLRNLTTVIERKADHREPYFILVATKPTGRQVIQERIFILDQMPHDRYLGCILIRVDNRHADAEILWQLPLDIPAPGFIETERTHRRVQAQEGVTSIMESAAGIALVNRSAN
jgi:hypothetical protein